VGTVVLDSGVVIGWLDRSDAHHAAAEAALENHQDDDLRLPASALAEVLVGHARRGSVEHAREALRALGLNVDPIGEPSAVAAAIVRARHPRFRLPDALIFGHAEAIGAEIVLTTDRRWQDVSPLVHVVA
jgi:predicted nucleic acid-binding protein